MLEHIKRNIDHPKLTEIKEGVKIEVANEMLCEVNTMQGEDDALDFRFSSMKQGNENHMKQQQVLIKVRYIQVYELQY